MNARREIFYTADGRLMQIRVGPAGQPEPTTQLLVDELRRRTSALRRAERRVRELEANERRRDDAETAERLYREDAAARPGLSIEEII